MSIFLRVSGQIWHNEGLSEFFGTNVLYGAGIEKQVSNHFKFGADADLHLKQKKELLFNTLNLEDLLNSLGEILEVAAY